MLKPRSRHKPQQNYKNFDRDPARLKLRVPSPAVTADKLNKFNVKD